MAVATATILTSCKKEDTPVIDDSNEITISFIDDQQPVSKAFFDPTTAPETWESSLSSLTVLVFDNGGKLLTQRIFNASEVTAKTANFAIPNIAAVTSCEFYAIANVAVPVSVMNKAHLLAMLESDPNVYNSTFTQASSQAVRSGGFVMSGSTTKTLASVGGKTNVAITLYRTVAKVAVKAATTAEFTNRYHGKVIVNKATITRAANQTNIIAPATINPGAKNYSYAQTSSLANSNYRNLFYLFENGSVATGNRVLLTLDATYDRDGEVSTTDDQAPVVYNVELTGVGNGDFSRNGYYRVAVNIDGLTGSDANATITVSPWGTPITQDVNLGQ